jgi:hypothetical protein
MRIKIACVLFLGFSIIGYRGTTEAKPIAQAVSTTKNQFEITKNNLKIINAITTVKRGGTGIITIQGAPNTAYSIETSYKLLNKTIPVIQWRKTDVTGVATFNWIVSMETIVGTYDATISGGENIIKTNHRVIK